MKIPAKKENNELVNRPQNELSKFFECSPRAHKSNYDRAIRELIDKEKEK